MAGPRVSLILCVRNGMPYLPQAVQSVVAQTYRDFELIVQDAVSTDGTLEYLSGVTGVPSIGIVSEPDGGIGDAYNRALRRCRGEIVGSIDADNLLQPDAVGHAVATLEERPEVACVYGPARIVDADGSEVRPFLPEPFDLVRVLACEIVPPFATAFFNRSICADLLRFDTRMTTCADYDLWLRLGHLPIASTPSTLGATRLSEKSMSRRADEYDVHCRNKLAALERFLEPYGDGSLIDALRRRSMSGIWLWAAESIWEIEGRSARFARYVGAASELSPNSARLSNVLSFPDPQEPPRGSSSLTPGTPATSGPPPDVPMGAAADRP